MDSYKKSAPILKGMVHYGLRYARYGELMLHGFFDYHLAGDASDKKTTSWCCFSFGTSNDFLFQLEAGFSGIGFSRGRVNGNQHCKL
jgi:hypothetical protein